jgi:hypothetical protein
MERVMTDDEPIMQFFSYTHLPPALQEVSKPFCELADGCLKMLPRCPERSVTLRKLLEAKDAAVRAAISPPVRWRDRPTGEPDKTAEGP